MMVRNEDADVCLSELTENSLMISNTQEVTKFNNNVLTNANKGGLYSNGLLTMTTTAGATCENSATQESSESSNAMAEDSMGPLEPSSSAALPRADVDVGLLSASFPESWNGWESKRRSESMGHCKNYWKTHHTKQLRHLKRIRRKNLDVKKVKAPSVVSFRRRRLRLERSVGRHLRDGCMKQPVILPPEKEESGMIPFQSSKSLRRRQRRRVVRFRDEEIAEATLEWKREKQKGPCFGRGLGNPVSNEAPFLEAHRERKQSQRALLDLQVGMKCMGL